ncbi:nitric oxide reductase transcriptional regulator NorR [Enhygromyxa salina]|uniref:Nitric oxide reductase transcription regulator NorR2 n=1 Tax=Enhygromyxa salina TaxID=215803 RepID=A0A2S9YM15_9BACT|nr:nitric oxide reductase transcriptional regulator NorR [Enhygromyxa salina]PRQ06145.1 Nitric oxide reductase transcription regulator NorR2 [Enhygromyxa salina]
MSRSFARNLVAAARCVDGDPGPAAAGRVLGLLREAAGADAAALLTANGQQLRVHETTGLLGRARGRQLRVGEHPRLGALLEAASPLVFAPDDPRPDPWDGFLLVDPQATVHACGGAALRGIDGRPRGVLTLDAASAQRFGPEIVGHLASFAALIELALDGDQPGLAPRRTPRARELIGESPAMMTLRRELELVAPSNLPVLIEGETGVGKELVAEAIHAASSRAAGPLVRLNCAALPESLAESELFGHRRGAFTGAVASYRGAFARADGGTLLLDEFGELEPRLQAKLLRVLQDGELAMLGEERTRRVDVRVIAASNQDLSQAVSAGRLRADLWYRVAGFRLRVPALRERERDILLFAEYFLDQASARLGLRAASLSPAAQRCVLEYAWPGNVRELEHRVARACLRVAARSVLPAVVEPADLELDEATPTRPDLTSNEELPAEGLAAAVDDLRRAMIERAVALSDGNWAEAARRLQIDRSNLHRMARRLFS